MEARLGNSSNHYPTTPDRRSLENGPSRERSEDGSFRQYLENSCLKYFDGIISHSACHEVNYLRDQTQTYFVSRSYRPDMENGTWLRLRQSVTIGAEATLNLCADSRGMYYRSSNEYQVYVLQSGAHPPLAEDPFMVRGPVWQDQTALIVKPANDEVGAEIYVVDQLTGEELDEEKLNQLVEILYSWGEQLQKTEPNPSCYDNCRPEIKLSPDERYNNVFGL